MTDQVKFNFHGKVAFITGASTGIGRATALAFGTSHASVVVADVNEDLGRQTVDMIKVAGGKSLFLECDVSKEADIKSAIEQTMKTFGRLDYAFNNAGIEGAQGFTEDCSVDNWQKVIDVNLRGVWLCMKYQVPPMLKTGGGAIVNCSSIAGLVGFPGIPPYVASKHAVVGLTKTAALENAKRGIRVNALCPGVIQTPMIDRFSHGEAQATKALVDGEPIGRMGQPDEMASVVLWLCSDGASFVTGHALAADGGWVAQ